MVRERGYQSQVSVIGIVISLLTHWYLTNEREVCHGIEGVGAAVGTLGYGVMKGHFGAGHRV